MKAPPESTKASLRYRLSSHTRDHWPALDGIDIRYRANFAYIDGRRHDGTILKRAPLDQGDQAGFQ